MARERTPRQIIDASLSEAEWQAWIVSLARARGWLVWYQPDWVYRMVVRDMQRRRVARDWPDAGFPDLWLVHPSGRMAVLECKSERGAVRAEQRRWIDALVASGIDARVVRPRHREDIEALLTER